MKFSIHQYIAFLNAMLLIFGAKFFEGKRNRHRHGEGIAKDEGKLIISIGTSQILLIAAIL